MRIEILSAPTIVLLQLQVELIPLPDEVLEQVFTQSSSCRLHFPKLRSDFEMTEVGVDYV